MVIIEQVGPKLVRSPCYSCVASIFQSCKYAIHILPSEVTGPLSVRDALIIWNSPKEAIIFRVLVMVVGEPSVVCEEQTTWSLCIVQATPFETKIEF